MSTRTDKGYMTMADDRPGMLNVTKATEARGSLFPALLRQALPGLGLPHGAAGTGFPLSLSTFNFLSGFFWFLSGCFLSLFWFLKKLRNYNVSKMSL